MNWKVPAAIFAVLTMPIWIWFWPLLAAAALLVWFFLVRQKPVPLRSVAVSADTRRNAAHAQIVATVYAGVQARVQMRAIIAPTIAKYPNHDCNFHTHRTDFLKVEAMHFMYLKKRDFICLNTYFSCLFSLSASDIGLSSDARRAVPSERRALWRAAVPRRAHGARLDRRQEDGRGRRQARREDAPHCAQAAHVRVADVRRGVR